MTTKPMRAYHNDPALKRATLQQMKAHRLADELVQGQYWRDGKGCAVACLTHDPAGAHAQYPVKWGIPEMLAHLEDRIFEGLTPELAQAWPERFLKAIPVGADLSKVGPRFLLAVVQRRYDALDTEGKRLVGPAMLEVIAVLKKWARTGKMTPTLAAAAYSAAASAYSAYSAAYSAAAYSAADSAYSAYSAAYSAAASADSAYSAAYSAAASADSAAAYSARSAADSADSAADSAAYSAEYEWMADTLVRLLKEAR